MPPRRRTFIFAALLLLGWLAGAAPTARADTSLRVRVGWEGMVHSGRWSPVFVTLADPTPRNVTLEIHTPYDNYHSIRVDQAMTIGPQPQTFPLYLPLRHLMPEDVSVVVRDARTRKRLAIAPSPDAPLTGGNPVDPYSQFLGISGKRTTLRTVADSLRAGNVVSGYLPPEELPADAIGYDCLDLLVLNAPDLLALSAEQQQAIADWVRSGGSLLMWPGESTVPLSGPLVDLLPCRIGSPTLVELPGEVLEKAGLSRRFGKLGARELTPDPGAEAVPLLGSDRLTAYRGRAGFGRVFVSPVDLSGFVFSDTVRAGNLWRGVLKGLIRRVPKEGDRQDSRYYGYGSDDATVREGAAVQEVADLLGDVPGAGRFGFGYVAAIMLGMMVIVGPVDWFVLKKLGRQPWTWVTTGGWCALVTLSAIYAGHLLKSGELYYRTFQLVEQVDGSVVARSDVTALYSPRTTEYEVTTPPGSWWQPTSPGDMYYYRRAMGTEVAFHQTYQDNRPEPMVVNVWNLRFLRGSSTVQSGPLVKADLRVVTGADGASRLVGRITNVGPTPLKGLAVRVKSGICVFAARAPSVSAIAPGQTANVDAVIDPETRPTEDSDPSDPRLRAYYGRYYGGTGGKADLDKAWETAANLAVRRADCVTRWLAERDDLACVYARVESPEPVAKLAGKQPIEQHYKALRALVPLGR